MMKTTIFLMPLAALMFIALGSRHENAGSRTDSRNKSEMVMPHNTAKGSPVPECENYCIKTEPVMCSGRQNGSTTNDPTFSGKHVTNVFFIL